MKKGILIFMILGGAAFSATGRVEAADWPMAGANPQRTNWSPEVLPDVISTQWVKPISPYVPQHVQVIGASVGNQKLVFVSTASGLYAFNADTGADVWQYPTALPLGNSPTYADGFLYVGGLDKKIHKINAADGAMVWTFTAEGGFVSNPIVVNGVVYAGSRDGAMYAINAGTGAQAWKYQTGHQINQSAAYKDGVIYFAAMNSFAYALNAQNGTLIWQSDADPATAVKDKFPSMGFITWWPVIYQNDVVFVRSGFYPTNGPEAFWLYCPAGSTATTCTSTSANKIPGIVGNEPGNWPAGEKTIDLRTNPYGNTLIDYFEAQETGDTRPQHGPFRRNAFFVNRSNGLERQFDLDSDGKTDAAPITWVGDTGTHDPPVVVGNSTASDADDVIYFHTVNRSRSLSFNGASISGWKVGTPFLSAPFTGYTSSDEPKGISAAGDKIYWNHCCDRNVGAVNVGRPNSSFPGTTAGHEWSYAGGGGLNFFSWPLDMAGLPNTQNNYYYKEAVKFFWDPHPGQEPPCCAAVFWNENEKVGPAIYNGRLYVILGNALVAMGAGGSGAGVSLSPSSPQIARPAGSFQTTDQELRNILEQEVSQMVAAGHLKPSFGSGLGHHSRAYEDNLRDMWHNPAELHLVLLRAMPYLSATLQTAVRSYLQTEFAQFPPLITRHIGYDIGTQRDPFPYPPAETVLRLFDLNRRNNNTAWSIPPINIYAMWKYVQAGLCTSPCSVSTLLTQAQAIVKATDGGVNGIVRANPILTDAYLAAFPNIHNAYLSGYIGYVELAKSAGQTPAQYAGYQAELDRLKILRKNNLKTFPDTNQNFGSCDNECYFESMMTHFNFAYLTPELGDYLRDNARSSDPDKDILAILQKYQEIAPYWMMGQNGQTQGEFTIMPYVQTHSLFQGLSQVKDAPRAELIRYLDTPLVPVGDLYYIDNLVAVLEAPAGSGGPASPVTATPTRPAVTGDINGDGTVNIQDFALLSNAFGTSNQAADLNRDGTVDILDYVILSNNFGR